MAASSTSGKAVRNTVYVGGGLLLLLGTRYVLQLKEAAEGMDVAFAHLDSIQIAGGELQIKFKMDFTNNGRVAINLKAVNLDLIVGGTVIAKIKQSGLRSPIIPNSEATRLQFEARTPILSTALVLALDLWNRLTSGQKIDNVNLKGQVRVSQFWVDVDETFDLSL